MLLSGLRPELDIVIIEPQSDGVKVITNYLADHSGIDILHIVSHGLPGAIKLGATTLSTATLTDYAQDLESWQGAFTDRPEILLYGCNVASGDIGVSFVGHLARFTGAEIAASTTQIGHAARGGDWSLDYRTAKIWTPLAFNQDIQHRYAGVFDTIPGSPDDDTLFGTAGDDVIDGGTTGNDFLVGLGGG